MRFYLTLVTVAAMAMIIAPPTTAAVPPGSDPALAEWPNWPYQASCYSIFDPIDAFSGPAEAELGSLPSQVALREIISSLSFPRLPQSDWRLISETDTEAVFENGDLSSPFPQWVLLKSVDSMWKLAGNGNCTPKTVLHGLAAVTWTIAGGQPAPSKDTRRIRVDLGPGPCSGGMSQNARARKPIFRQLGRRLLMTILLEPLPPGSYTCQGVIEPPLEVRLPGRLGTRRLYDGGTFPPGDVARIWRERAARERAARR
jgi:hypothetical protein